MLVSVTLVEGKDFLENSLVRLSLGGKTEQTSVFQEKDPKLNCSNVFEVQDANTENMHIALLEDGKDDEYASIDIPLSTAPESPQSFALKPSQDSITEPNIVAFFQIPYFPVDQSNPDDSSKVHYEHHVSVNVTNVQMLEQHTYSTGPDGTKETHDVSGTISHAEMTYDSSGDENGQKSSRGNINGFSANIQQSVTNETQKALTDAGILNNSEEQGDLIPASRTVIDEKSSTKETTETKDIPSLSDWSSDDENLGKSLSDWSTDDENAPSLSDNDENTETNNKDGSSTKTPTTTTEKTKTLRLLNDLNLHVKIISAEKLPPTDINGKTDAYCILTYNGQEKKTKVVKNSLDPEWNAQFSIKAQGAMESYLEIKVIDEDPVHNDPIGKVIVPIKSMEVGKVADEWFDLIPVLKLPEPIEIKSRIHIVYQLAEKDKDPFEEYKIESAVVNIEFLEGADEIQVGMNNNLSALKQGQKSQIDVVNVMDDNITIKLGDNSTQIQVASLGLCQIMDDFWEINGTKLHLKLEIREKSAQPFSE